MVMQIKLVVVVLDTKTKYLCIVICPTKFTLAHNVFEVTELCRTGADILKPTLDRTLVASLEPSIWPLFP